MSQDGPRPSTDERTLSEVLDGLRADGFTEDAEAVSGSEVRCSSCGETSDPAELRPEVTHRLEGESDPADMAVVHGVVCPRCGARAVLVLGYGPNASPEEADVSRALRNRP